MKSVVKHREAVLLFSNAKLGLRMPSLREIEVLRELVCGKTNKVTGRHLGISVKTVEAHRANIQRKLGVRGVAELIMKTLRLGLVPMPDFDKAGKLRTSWPVKQHSRSVST